jgi:hypothetical protein
MTLLSVVRDVCANVGVVIPTTIFSGINGNRTMQEFVSLANELAQRIAYDGRDWTILRKTVTLVGDGITEAFSLPVNYKRMLLTSNVWRSTQTMAPMRFVPDTDEWLNRRARNFYDSYGEWTMMGGNIHIAPVMGVGTTAYFAYLDKNCIVLNSGGTGDSFIFDSDSFILDERVLKLGMTWEWKARKGSPYQEDLGTYQDALDSVGGRDSPAPIFVGRLPISRNAKVAYPFPVPT